MIKKAIKKPIEIEYITFNELWDFVATWSYGGEVSNEIFDKVGKVKILLEEVHTVNTLVIPTLEGNMKMTDKDYLIIGVRGEIYPCKIDIFEETYNIID
jgi:hypothetical protein